MSLNPHERNEMIALTTCFHHHWFGMHMHRLFWGHVKLALCMVIVTLVGWGLLEWAWPERAGITNLLLLVAGVICSGLGSWNISRPLMPLMRQNNLSKWYEEIEQMEFSDQERNLLLRLQTSWKAGIRDEVKSVVGEAMSGRLSTLGFMRELHTSMA